MMKQSVRKKHRTFSLVEGSPALQTNLDSNQVALERRVHGWLAPVERRDNQSHLRPLTTVDFLQVNLATVRESHVHRFWPPAVIAKFLTADVIARESQEQTAGADSRSRQQEQTAGAGQQSAGAVGRSRSAAAGADGRSS